VIQKAGMMLEAGSAEATVLPIILFFKYTSMKIFFVYI